MNRARRAWRWATGRPWLAVLAITVIGQLGQYRAMEAERHDRCVDGRRDTRSAILGVVDRLGRPTPQERAQLVEVLEDELPSSTC